MRRGEQIVRVVQVAHEMKGNGAAEERELGALNEAAGVFPKAERLLVVQRRPTAGIDAGQGVTVRSLWQFLLAPNG